MSPYTKSSLSTDDNLEVVVSTKDALMYVPVKLWRHPIKWCKNKIWIRKVLKVD